MYHAPFHCRLKNGWMSCLSKCVLFCPCLYGQKCYRNELGGCTTEGLIYRGVQTVNHIEIYINFILAVFWL